MQLNFKDHCYIFWLNIFTHFIFSFCLDDTRLKYIWGDALEDPLAPGPDGQLYPWDMVSKIASKQRNSRSMFAKNDNSYLSPQQTRQILLNSFSIDLFEPENNNEYLPPIIDNENSSSHNEYDNSSVIIVEGQGSKHNNTMSSMYRQGRENLFNNGAIKGESNSNSYWSKQQRQDFSEGCVPSRLCATTYNTTAPLYGISLTSGKPVTIVQKFPDLLQQVVFQVCKSTECEVLQGECVQTYLPYLFLVLPLGPVTLTGQDYVLVESGCVCQPKYAKQNDQPTAPLPFIKPLNQ